MKLISIIIAILLLIPALALGAGPYGGLPATGTLMVNPMTTAGDIIYGGADGAATRLAKGANGSILGINGAGVLGWYSSISIDNSAAQFYDADTTTKLIKISPVNVTATKTFTFAPTVADDVTFSPTISATDFNIGAVNMVSTGTIDGGVKVTVKTDATSPITVSGSSGIYINGHDSVVTYNLPAAAANKAFCFRNLYARVITINPDDSDYITIGGTKAAAGEAIVSAGAATEMMCLVGMDAGNWISMGSIGTWAEEAP